MRIYHDGVEVGNGTRISQEEERVPNEGRIFVGKFRPFSATTFAIDEMLFFNNTLCQADISLLSTDNE